MLSRLVRTVLVKYVVEVEQEGLEVLDLLGALSGKAVSEDGAKRICPMRGEELGKKRLVETDLLRVLRHSAHPLEEVQEQ